PVCVSFGRWPGHEEVGDILRAPVGEPLLRNVGHPALAFGIGAAGETLRLDDATEEIARAVTLRAMSETVDEIGAAIPRGRTGGVRRERFAVHEQPFPDADVTADVERKRHVVIARPAGPWRPPLSVRDEV